MRSQERDSDAFLPCGSPALANCPFREDIIAVMEDVEAYGLVHGDVTAFNLLCFKGGESPQARCPRHNVVHGQRVIDFDRSHKVEMVNVSYKAKRTPGKYNPAFIGSSATFWGNCL